MPVDADRGRQIQSLLGRLRQLSPKLADEALQNGNFSAIDDANAQMDRLSKLGDAFVQEVHGGQQEQPTAQQPNPSTPRLTSQPIGPQNDRMPQETGPGESGGVDVGPTLNKAYRIDKNGYDAETENALRQAQQIQTPRLASAMPQGQATPAQPTVQAAPKQPDKASAAMDDVLSAAPQQEATPRIGGQEDQQEPDSSTVPDIKPILPHVEKDYGGNALALMADMGDEAKSGSPAEREFFRRVQVELGDRPKMFTVAKLLAGLALGAGSIVGAWMTKRYSGQALLDNDAPQEEYDRQKQKIASEVYNKYAGLEKADANQKGMLSRLDFQRNRIDELEREKAKNAVGLEGVKQTGREKLQDTKGGQATDLQMLKGQQNLERDKARAENKAANDKLIRKMGDVDAKRIVSIRASQSNLQSEKFRLTQLLDPLKTPPSKQQAIKDQIDQISQQQAANNKERDAIYLKYGYQAAPQDENQ